MVEDPGAMLGPETDREGVRANGPVNPAPILRYTTDDLPPEDRYRTWYLRDWPRSEPIFRTVPTEPFNTRWESVQLGSVMFVYTEISGMRWERRRQDIRVSDFDPIIVNMMIEGEAQGDMDGRPFHETAGTFHFHDLSRPSLHASTASLTYSVVIPRPVAEQWFAPLQDLHGLVIGGAAARTRPAQRGKCAAAQGGGGNRPAHGSGDPDRRAVPDAGRIAQPAVRGLPGGRRRSIVHHRPAARPGAHGSGRYGACRTDQQYRPSPRLR